MAEDFESAVIPYQLCSVCQRVAATYTPDEHWQRESFFEDERMRVTTRREGGFEEYRLLPDILLYWKSRRALKHHSDLSSLRKSAENGCHLCALFVGALWIKEQPFQETIRNESSGGNQLYITPGIPYPSPEGQCSWISLELFDTHPTIRATHLSRVEIHQHLKDTKQQFCSSALEDVSEQSIESRSRWSNYTGSIAGSRMIAEWLEYCTTHHKDCKKTPADPCMPTRLLDLEMASPDVRLVYGSDVGVKPYATLSYCWGRCPTVTLQTKNYQEFFSQIKVEILPKTIQEAIEICRRLAIRYLWIDALCITQGDGKDFAHEVSRMGSIYAGSLVTIAAADSSDCDSGCFRSCSPLYREDCHLWEDEEKLLFFRGYLDCVTPNFYLGNQILDSRAWVYQERMMSPRTIHFCRDEVFWECRECVLCYHRAHSAERKGSSERKSLFKILQTVGWEYSDHKDWLNEAWKSILQQYSGAVISNEDDRLSALAGIAEFPQKNPRNRASFGLWLPVFVYQLLWCVSGDWKTDVVLGYNSLHSIPSWSWVGVKGRVSNLSGHLGLSERELYLATVTELPAATPFAQISVILKQLVQPVVLKIRGWLASCRPVPLPRMRMYRKPDQPDTEKFGWTLRSAREDLPTEILSDEESSWKLYLSTEDRDNYANCDSGLWERKLPTFRDIHFFPDAQPETPRTLACFLVGSALYYQLFGGKVVTLVDIGLVLEETGTKRNRFRRVGLFKESIWCDQVGCTTDHHKLAEFMHQFSDQRDMVEALREHMTLFRGEQSEVEIEIV